jgi:hypothetical protein
MIIMMKKIITMTLVLISTSIFSQITLSTKLIIGKDTIPLKHGQSIESVLDSINKVRLDKYYAERQRIEDSTEMAYIDRCKKGPHLYFNTVNDENKSYIEIENDPEEVVKIIDTTKFKKIDSLITYSDMSYEVLDKINSQRTQKMAIDSNRQEIFSEEMILTYFLKKDVAVLEKVIYERCPTECYEEVFRYITKKKKLMKILLTEDLEYINITIIEDRRSVMTFINYKQKNNKNEQYKIVYIR